MCLNFRISEAGQTGLRFISERRRPPDLQHAPTGAICPTFSFEHLKNVPMDYSTQTSAEVGMQTL